MPTVPLWVVALFYLSILHAGPRYSVALKTCVTGDVDCYSSIPPNPCSLGGIAQVPAFRLSEKKQLRKRVKGRVPVVLKGANIVTSASHWSPRYLARHAKRMQINRVRAQILCVGHCLRLRARIVQLSRQTHLCIKRALWYSLDNVRALEFYYPIKR